MIVGKRIRLRAIEYEDLPLLAKWRNDPDVYRYFYEHEPISLVMQKAWFEDLMQKPDQRFWIIETLGSYEPIGTVGLLHIDWRNRKAECGRLLIYSEELRGSGYGSETESLILRYFFDHMNMHRLTCEVLGENERGLALHIKFGFKEEGVFRQHVFKSGSYHDVVCIAMLREDYSSSETQAMISKYLD